jgi:hypothetical protein
MYVWVIQRHCRVKHNGKISIIENKGTEVNKNGQAGDSGGETLDEVPPTDEVSDKPEEPEPVKKSPVKGKLLVFL